MLLLCYCVTEIYLRATFESPPVLRVTQVSHGLEVITVPVTKSWGTALKYGNRFLLHVPKFSIHKEQNKERKKTLKLSLFCDFINCIVTVTIYAWITEIQFPEEGKIFLFNTPASRATLGFTQPPLKRILASICQVEERQGRKTFNSPLFTGEF
jgi:hypothetical protein